MSGASLRLSVPPAVLPEDVVGSARVVGLSHVTFDGSAYLFLDASREEFLNYHAEFDMRVSEVHTRQRLESGVQSGWAAGDFCIIHYSRESIWYRGQVKERKPTSIAVQFIDYGFTRFLKPEEIFKVSVEVATYFTALRAQAIPVRLQLNLNGASAAYRHLKELSNKSFVCRRVIRNGAVVTVVLHDANDGMPLVDYLAAQERVSVSDFEDLGLEAGMLPVAPQQRDAAADEAAAAVAAPPPAAGAEAEEVFMPIEPQPSRLNPDSPEFRPFIEGGVVEGSSHNDAAAAGGKFGQLVLPKDPDRDRGDGPPQNNHWQRGGYSPPRRQFEPAKTRHKREKDDNNNLEMPKIIG